MGASTLRDAVVRRRLDYIELIVWFAFEEKVFLIIFFIAGFLTILISVILWTSVRLTTMLENPPRVRIWSTLLLIIVPPFQGVLLGFIPIFVAQMSMSLLIKRVPASRDLGAASTASGGVVRRHRCDPRFSPREGGLAVSAPMFSAQTRPRRPSDTLERDHELKRDLKFEPRRPIMAEDALFAFIPGYPVRRDPGVPSRRRCDSWPSHDAGGGFIFEFELFRTASGPSRRVRVAAMASS